MDALATGLLAATAGAAVGAFGTWLADRLRDRERDHADRHRGFQEKLHDLELRIVRMETKLGYYAGVAVQRIEGVGHAQQG